MKQANHVKKSASFSSLRNRCGGTSSDGGALVSGGDCSCGELTHRSTHLSCGDQKTSLKRSQFLTYALQFFYSSYTIPSTHILAYFRISYLVCIKFGLFLACSSHALLISSLFSPQTSTLSPPVPLPLALRLPLRLVRLLQEAPQRPGRERRRSHVEAHGEH